MEDAAMRKRLSWALIGISAALVLATGFAGTTAVRNTKLAHQYASVLDAAEVGLVTADKNGVIVSANTVAQNLFGDHHMIGRHIHSYCHTADSRDRANTAFAKAMRSAISGAAPATVEVRCTLQSASGPTDVQMHIRVLRQGADVTVLATITPLANVKTIDLTASVPH